MDRFLAHEELGLMSFDYRHLVIDTTPLQRGINRHIGKADLAILVLGTKPGDGLREELDVVTQRLITGVIGTAMLYFTNAVSSEHATQQECAHFLQKKKILYHQISDLADFESRVREHLLRWLSDERRIAERQNALFNTDFFEEFRIPDLALLDEIQELHKLKDDNPALIKLSESAYRKYLTNISPDDAPLSDIEHYLVARFLKVRVQNDDWKVCQHKEFQNPIHQHLSSIIRSTAAETRQVFITTLRKWLRDQHNIREKARNFAAYELGMCLAREAADDLLWAVANPREESSIRFYGALALGKLRERSTIIPMLDILSAEKHGSIREAIRLSILYMTA